MIAKFAKLRVEVVVINVNVLTKHALANNSRWSAECTEFASIVIEFVIGILLSQITVFETL